MSEIRSIYRLREELRLRRAQGLTWAEVARAEGILMADGEPYRTLVWRIVMQGYEPMEPHTRQILGLPRKCPACHRAFPIPRPSTAHAGKHVCRRGDLTRQQVSRMLRRAASK